MVKQISDYEIYLLIEYIESVLWREVKRLSYIQDARCLKVNPRLTDGHYQSKNEQKKEDPARVTQVPV